MVKFTAPPWQSAPLAAGRSVALLAAMFALAALPTDAAAQARTGTVAGTVTDSLHNPVSGVEITAVGTGRVVRSDSAGEFTVSNLPAGRAELTFRRLAFTPVALTVSVPPSDTTDIEVMLGVVAQQLTAVVVQAHPDLSRLVEFEARRKQGIGHFITRSQIEQRHPMLLSDMLRTVPGAVIIPADNGRTSVRFSRVGRNNCPPQFFVDGIEVSGFSIDDMPPGDVEGMELYAGAAGLPPEYNRLHGTSICGTVIIWSRDPSASRRNP